MKSTQACLVLFLALAAGASARGQEPHPAEKYAWSFNNFISDPCVPGSDYFSWQRYMETYIGIPAEPANNFGFDYLWYEAAFKKRGDKGNCYGMSLLSALINQKGGHLGYCGPVGQYSGDNVGVPTPDCPKGSHHTLGPTDPLLLRAIEEMHGHQLNLANVRFALEQFAKGYGQDAGIAYSTVLQEKAQGRPCLISIIKKQDDPFGGGHVVLAYDAKQVSGQKRIYVYDPNRPWPSAKSWYDPDTDTDFFDGENYIEIDGNDYRFQFGAEEEWPEVSGLIFAIPLAIAGPRDRTPASLGTSAGQLATEMLLAGSAGGGSASLAQATSLDGRTLFIPSTRLPQANPDKGLFSIVPLYTLDGLPGGLEGEISEHYAIIDPPAGGLDFDVVSSGEGYEMLLASRGSRVTVRARGGRGTDRVRLQDIGTRSPRVLLFNRLGAEDLELEIDRPAGASGRSRTFRLRRISMPRGGLLEVGLGEGGEGLDIVSPIHDAAFELELETQEGRTRRTSRLTPIVLGAGEVGSFAPEDWSDPSLGEVVTAARRLTLSLVESYCDFVDGPGNGPAGEHFSSTRDVGSASGGRTVHDSRSGQYTQTSSGAEIGRGGDSFHFAYEVVEGDFELTVEVLDRTGPLLRGKSLAKHGLMARQDCTPAAKYSLLDTRLFGTGTGAEDEWPRWSYRRVHGDAVSEGSTDDRQRFNYDPDQSPRFLKMVRRGKTFHGFFSPDGRDWRPVGSDTWYGERAGGSVLVGFASTSGPDAGGAPSTVRFKVLGFGPIDPALEPLLPGDAAASGVEVHRNEFASAPGSPPEAMQVNRRAGAFTPRIQNGRLRLTDEGAPGAAVSAFSEHVLQDIDSAVHSFAFDVFFTRRPGFDPGEGLTFVVTGGPELGRVGFEAGGLGYDLLGRQVGTDRNVSRPGFAVELDTARGTSDAEGAGSPDAPRSLHVGIDGFGNINTLVLAQENLPDPFAPEGVHVRVDYNRGRVTVHLGPGGADAASLVKVLAVDMLPVSFAALDEAAVFGFTGATGELTQTAEVDNLVVTRVDCSDAQEVAVIDGAPEAPASVGSIVTLDGSFSNGGPGDEAAVTHLWRVAEGPAAIEGPNDGPTVNVKLLGEGSVAVDLTVDDGRCDNPATARAAFVAGAAQGNWIRCDADGDGGRNITDPIVTLGWLFLGRSEPSCLEALDCMKDGRVDITDAIFDLSFLFLGGAPPAAPYPACDTFASCGAACPR